MNSPHETAPTMAEPGHYGVGESIRSGQQAAHRAVDRMADRVDRVAHSADQVAQRSAEALRESRDHLRERARHAAESTIVHIRQDPMKSVLIAAALGAALGLFVAMVGRSRY